MRPNYIGIYPYPFARLIGLELLHCSLETYSGIRGVLGHPRRRVGPFYGYQCEQISGVIHLEVFASTPEGHLIAAPLSNLMAPVMAATWQLLKLVLSGEYYIGRACTSPVPAFRCAIIGYTHAGGTAISARLKASEYCSSDIFFSRTSRTNDRPNERPCLISSSTVSDKAFIHLICSSLGSKYILGFVAQSFVDSLDGRVGLVPFKSKIENPCQC